MDELKNKLSTGTLKTPQFTLQNNIYLAKCVKCYDADTIHIVIEFEGKLSRFLCRLLGIDTAELRSKDHEEKKYAKEARDYLKSLILDKLVIVKCGDFDKYGRLLVLVYPYNEGDVDQLNQLGQLGGGIVGDKKSYNDLLIDEKWAYKYLGGKKLAFSEWSQK